MDDRHTVAAITVPLQAEKKIMLLRNRKMLEKRLLKTYSPLQRAYAGDSFLKCEINISLQNTSLTIRHFSLLNNALCIHL